VSHDVLLIPNVGAEEAGEWGEPEPADRERPVAKDAVEPFRQLTTRLWSTLFGDACHIVDAAPEAVAGRGADPGVAAPTTEGRASQTQRWWPSALGPRPGAAVFPWLDAPAAAAAWLNTPAAEGLAQRAGRQLIGASSAVVRTVHDKAFAHRAALEEGLLPEGLVDCIEVLEPALLRDADAALAAIEARLARWPSWTQGRFTLKPRLGTSGRGRASGEAGQWERVRGSLPRLAQSGGAVLEPWLARSGDFSAQLWIGSEGELVLLGTAELLVEPSGLYRGHRGFVDSKGRVTSGSRYDEPLREAAVAVARVAATAGYRGPCGIDAFAFEAEPGRVALRSVVEFNARFTFGTVVIGLLRRALPRIRDELSLGPGALRAFQFTLDAPAGGWPDACSAGRALCLRLEESAGQPGLLVAESMDGLSQLLGQRRPEA
jgi:hypothetical protein